jgi:hypothetical protein
MTTFWGTMLLRTLKRQDFEQNFHLNISELSMVATVLLEKKTKM